MNLFMKTLMGFLDGLNSLYKETGSPCRLIVQQRIHIFCEINYSSFVVNFGCVKICHLLSIILRRYIIFGLYT